MPGRGRGQRSASSQRWLARQAADPYVARAKAMGYRSRAAFKLAEIDDRHHLLKPGQTVLDLGAAPGGWSQVAAVRVHSLPGAAGRGRVVAVDLSAMDAIAGVDVRRLDVHDPAALQPLREALGGPADLVLSDMAPAASGHPATDHLRSAALVEAALDLAEALLKPGGAFLAKLLQGGEEAAIAARLKASFAVFRRLKPRASRSESAEIYLLATGYRGNG